MKKILTIIVVAALLFVFAACADKKENQDFTPNTKNDIAKEQEETEKEVKQKEEPFDINNPLGFENERLYNAVCYALMKDPTLVTQEDILNVKYLSIDLEDNGEYTVLVGLSDYIDAYFELVNNPDDTEIYKKLISLTRKASFENDEQDVFSDIAKFTKVNVFEYYDIPINDVSFLKNLNELYFGYFNSNGITDVSALSDYNPKTLRELDFTGNDIEDWSALEDIKDKVIVHYSVKEYDNGKGEKIQVPFELRLSEKIEQDKQQKDKEENQSQQQKEQAAPSLVDKDGNPVDFSSLFE